MKLAIKKPDTVGATASLLCLIHCVLTPIIFIAQACPFDECGTSPIWWKNIDYLFLLISFFSIFRSTQTTSKRYMVFLLWSSWSLLSFLIINEKLELFSIPEIVTYVTATSLALLHIYNLKYCQCKDEKCCVGNE